MSAQRELGGHTRSQRQHPQTWREPPRQVPEPRGRGPDIAGGVWTVRCELHITSVHPQVCAASPLCAFIYQIIIQPLFTYSVPSCHRAPPRPTALPPSPLPPTQACSELGMDSSVSTWLSFKGRVWLSDGRFSLPALGWTREAGKDAPSSSDSHIPSGRHTGSPPARKVLGF